MNYKRDTAVFSLIYVLSYAAYAMGTTQFVPYLTQIGYTSVERGILLSSIAVVTIIIQMVFGYLSDKYKTVKKLFIAVFLVFSSMAFIFYNSEVKNLVLHIVLIASCGGFYNLAMGMGDNWILESEEPIKRIYSGIRAFGSLGWAIGSVVVAYIISRMGYGAVGTTLLFIAVVTVCMSLILKDASKRYDESRKPITKEDLIKLCKNKTYILVVFILLLLNCIMMFNTYTVVDKILYLGGTNREVGIFCTVKGLVEIPMFFLGTVIVERYRHTAILFVSGLMFTIQFAFFAAAKSIIGILFIGGMQIVTNPLFVIAAKVLVDELSDDSCKSTGQLVAMSIYSGVSALVVPYLSGILSSSLGINFTLWFAAGLGMLAVLLTLKIKIRKPRRVTDKIDIGGV